MGSSSSVLHKLDFQYNNDDVDDVDKFGMDEEEKEEPIEDNFGYILEPNRVEIQSAVWYSIHAVIKTISTIRKDFRNEKDTTTLYEVLKKVMINIDSIHHICNTTFEFENIQQINKKTLTKAIKTLKEFYETKPVIVVRINKYQNIVNLDKFTYSIFKFVDTHGYLGVYV